MVKRALVLLAENCEEIELVVTVDTLRRANIHVIVASLSDVHQPISCHNRVRIMADVDLKTVANEPFDCIVIPGGPGHKALCQNQDVGTLLQRHFDDNILIAAICAGPEVLKAHGIGFGRKITSYPSNKESLAQSYDYQDGARVVRDGNLITSRNTGTSFEFALEIVHCLAGQKQMKDLASHMDVNM